MKSSLVPLVISAIIEGAEVFLFCSFPAYRCDFFLFLFCTFGLSLIPPSNFSSNQE